MGISYHSYIGKTVDQLPTLPSTVIGNVSLNTPVGSCIDHFGHVWLADTAHNRILIFDAEMEQLLASFGSTGDGSNQFNMPFRLLAHPDKNLIYVTDIGNFRVHILSYGQDLSIESIKTFGNSKEVGLKGPNGIVFYQNELCVADEFYEGPDGESRLVIFSEDGDYKRDIHAISNGDGNPIHLLWPQGLSVDNNGALYIANTGFNTVVRCNWQGEGIPFTETKKPYIDGLELARDVSYVQGKILIPGGDANAISVYGSNGKKLGVLTGFFSPIQITERANQELLITEPILASLQLHQINLKKVQGGKGYAPTILKTVGDERDQPGQFHFVTSAAGEIVPGENTSGFNASSELEKWINYQQDLQEQMMQAMQPPGLPSWLSMGISWQTEWLQRWQQSWLRIVLGEKFEDADDLLWMVDAGNYQLQASEDGKANSARPASLPLLPGSLGIAALKPQQPLPGQLDSSVPLLVVSNYLSSIVTIYQYSPLLGELIPYTVFGSVGSAPWQLNKPQGIAIDPTNNDILIADSGNNRIARWRLTSTGIAGLVDVFGQLGSGNDDFHTPSDIAADDNGMLYITDQFNNRIQVFDGQGNWQRSFGEAGYGTDNANFLLPTSIEYDRGHLFISDLVNRAIKVFDTQDQIIDSFAAFGADASKGQLWMPYLLHARDGRLYLPDCALNRINVYHFEH